MTIRHPQQFGDGNKTDSLIKKIPQIVVESYIVLLKLCTITTTVHSCVWLDQTQTCCAQWNRRTHMAGTVCYCTVPSAGTASHCTHTALAQFLSAHQRRCLSLHLPKGFIWEGTRVRPETPTSALRLSLLIPRHCVLVFAFDDGCRCRPTSELQAKAIILHPHLKMFAQHHCVFY